MNKFFKQLTGKTDEKKEESAIKKGLKIFLAGLKALLIKAAILLTIVLLLAGIVYLIKEAITDAIKKVVNGISRSSYISAGNGSSDGIIDSEDINFENGIEISDDVIQKLIDKIESEDLKLEDLYLSGDVIGLEEGSQEYITERNKYLKKFMLAQLCTEFPDFGIEEDDSHFNGIIKIKRASGDAKDDSDRDNVSDMSYISMKEFNSWVEQINGGDYTHEEDIKLVYTIDAKGNLYFVNWVKVEYLPEGDHTFSVTVQSVNYLNTVDKFTMPIAVPLALCQVTENPEYVSQFIDKFVLGGQIVITLLDNKSVDTYDEWYNYTVTATTVSPTIPPVVTVNTAYHEKQKWHERITTEVTSQAQVTLADTWIAKTVVTYKNNKNIVDNDEEEKIPAEFPESRAELPKLVQPSGIGVTTYSVYCEEVMKDYMVHNEWSRNNVEVDEDTIEQKAKDIIRQWDEDFKKPNSNTTETVGPKIVDGALILFDILEETNAQKQCEIYKYLVYLYTNVDYGETSINSSIYEDVDLYEYSSYETDLIVEVSRSPEELILSKEEIESAIENTYTGQIRTNLLSALDAFYKIQDEQKVNAIFAIAVAMQESSGGTNWGLISSQTYNWMSVTASSGYKDKNGTTWAKYNSFSDATEKFGKLISSSSYYFGGGHYTVREIAESYCVPPENWANGVISIMKKLYDTVNVDLKDYIETTEQEINGTDAESEKAETYTNPKTGATYKNYKQGSAPWGSREYAKGTMSGKGCCPTAVAIAISAKNSSVTPETIRQTQRIDTGLINTNELLETYYTIRRTESFSQDEITEHLSEGNPVIIHVGPASTFTENEHWLVLLDYDKESNRAYVSNPNTSGSSGWTSMKTVMQGMQEVIYLE